MPVKTHEGSRKKKTRPLVDSYKFFHGSKKTLKKEVFLLYPSLPNRSFFLSLVLFAMFNWPKWPNWPVQCWESFFPISGLNNFIPTAVLWSISTATSCKTAKTHHGFSMDVLVREENKNEQRNYAKTIINIVLIPNYKIDRFASAPHISSWCKTSCLVTIEWARDILASPSNTNDMSLF